MIPLVQPFLPPRDVLMPALEETLYSGYIAEGQKVKDFEQKFSSFIQHPYCLSVNSGSSALHIALILAGVSKGDEVITTALTAEPTNTIITQTGAKVVWADVDPRTGLIDPVDAEQKITPKTKAIVVVHYAGMVADLASFERLSKRFTIPIIEDAAHALGARYREKNIGSISPYTIFSFQAIKHMTTVDGGMITVAHSHDAEKARLIRWFGLDKTKTRFDNDIQIQGYKYHMNNVNATIGLVQLSFIDKIINTHISNGQFFDRSLAQVPGVTLIPYYKDTEPSYWLYTMLVENRTGFIKKLESSGISASEVHKRNDRHSLFTESKTHLPALDSFYEKMVHLPCGWWVNEESRTKIVDTIRSGW